MSIHWRPMRAKDMRDCVEIAAASAILRPRYGSAIHQLERAWLNLIRRGGGAAVVWEETDRGRLRLLGCGISVFVSDEFMQELKTPPFRWFGPTLIDRLLHNDRSLLSEKEIGEANSTRGLNLVAWDAFVSIEDFKRPEVFHAVMGAFIENHRGFLLKDLIAQSSSAEHVQQMVDTGGLLLSPEDGRPAKVAREDAVHLISEPHVVTMNRDVALSEPGLWISSLFVGETPKVGFRRSEQSLLLAALRGGTDEELSDELGISLSAVKKAWRTIYERVAPRVPNLIPDALTHDGARGERGKSKKHRMLAYLRDHPEELRPISRRLLRQNVDT